MGCYVGGFLALDLALEYPDKFRAVIGVGAAQRGGPATLDTFYHPNVTNDYRRVNAMYFCSPMTPEKYRREVTWCAMQCAAPTTKGDLYYYFKEHDLTGKTHFSIPLVALYIYSLVITTQLAQSKILWNWQKRLKGQNLLR